MSDQNSIEDISFDLPKHQSSVIKVIGVGGGGSNAINHMYGLGIKGVDFVVCNTDSQALENSPVPNKVQLGVTLTEGLGAGANPEVGMEAALENIEEIKSLLETNTKMVFITAGMGGGTGTGAAPVIAKAAKDLGILTVGICTIPFQFEGSMRKQQAEKGVEALRNNVDSLVVINNNKLREVYGNLGFKAGFAKADEVLATAARGIAEVITHHYTTNIDLRDARTVLANSGTAIMGSATASGEQRAGLAISRALDSPLLNDNHIRGAKNVLLLIVSGQQEITIDEIGEINDHIQQEAGGSANIIMGIGEDENLKDESSVTIIATGFAVEQQVQVIGREPQKVIHTLEDEQELSNTVFERPLTKLNEDEDDLIDAELARVSRQEDRPQPNLFDLHDEVEDEIDELPQDIQPPILQSEFPAGVEEDVEIEMPEAESMVIEEPEADLAEGPVAEEQEEATFEMEEAGEEEETSEPIFEIDQGEADGEERTIFFLEDEDDFEAPAAAALEEEETKFQNDEVQEAAPARTEQPIRYSLEDYTELETRLRSAKPEAEKAKPVEGKEEEIQDEKEDESLHFEVRQLESRTGGESDGSVSPMDHTIEESMRMRVEERKAKLKAFNYRFKNHPYSIDEVANEPAYKRQGVKIEDTKYSDDSRAGRFTIEDGDGGSDIKTNNTFLHDNVD